MGRVDFEDKRHSLASNFEETDISYYSYCRKVGYFGGE